MTSEKNRSAQLSHVLMLPQDAVSHDEAAAQLDDYVAAQLAGEDYRKRFPSVARHLDACVECAEAYALCYERALAEASGGLPQPARLPEPDLSFLAPSMGQSLVDLVRAAVQRAGEQFRLQLTPDLLPALRPAYAAAPVRAAGDGPRYNEVILRLAPAEELSTTWPAGIVAYRDAQNPDHCLVEVTVAPPGRSWPDLAGIEVTLAVGAERRSETTDAWGAASFEATPITGLGAMSISIQGM